MVRSTGWVKFTLNSILYTWFCQDLLIPVSDVTFCKSFLSLAIKLVPLFDQRTDGVPRRAANRSIPITQLLVSIDGTTSKWTARVVRQVKRNPQRFSVCRTFHGHVEGTKVVDSCVAEWRFSVCKSFPGKIGHHGS